jgi:hypothetical protein
MSNKQTKTREELAAIINEWLKSHPECDKVTGVAIAHIVRIADDRHNWHAAFTMADGDAVPAIALHIVGQLSAEFDLA